MIFVQPFYNNFDDNFLSHTHIIFLLSLPITLTFVLIHTIVCKNMVVYLVIKQIDVQITLLFFFFGLILFTSEFS